MAATIAIKERDAIGNFVIVGPECGHPEKPLGYCEESTCSFYVQTDWDYPGVASSFGWNPCPCGMTDGTVDCSHRTASEMIISAGDYLSDHIGDTADDPGYLSRLES